MAKRSLSDSDCDDLFSDTKDSCMTPPGAESCGHHVSRKKRRGIIEKRRRDRINNSLTELRRLVPTAFEKQGSAKLEKAEILQMTVDHLKMLHSKGLDALAYDPHKFAMDYHTIGFRECASEVARYLVTVEGMNTQDPLRLRLMSHLQCFVAQRELANKQASASSWGLNPLTPSPSYTINSHHLHHLNSGNSGGLSAPSSLQSSQHGSLMEPASPDQYILPHNTSHSNMSNDPLLGHHHQHHQHQQLGGNGQQSAHLQHTNSSNSNNMGSSPHQRPISASSGSYQHPMSPYGMHQNNNNTTGYIPNGKPYRPWGAELAY